MTLKPSNLLWVRESIPWMGRYSGYDRLFQILEMRAKNCYQSVFRNRGLALPRGSNALFRRSAKRLSPSPFYNKHSLWTELQAVKACLSNRVRLIHVTYVENNLGLSGRVGRLASVKTVGTAHQPVSWWQKNRMGSKLLSNLDALIVLSEKELNFFDAFLPGRVYRIPHGVDTDFFRPPPEPIEPGTYKGRPRCVFAGVWLRDFETLVDIINLVTAEETDTVFDFVVPRHHHEKLAFQRIAQPDRVRWYADLTDEELREVYWHAKLLVLPLIDCTANNALLEAIACGLPVVSNRVGGVAEYTDRSFAELLPAGDVRGMADAIRFLLKTKGEEKQRAARAFAETNLSWQKIVPRMESLYLKIIASI